MYKSLAEAIKDAEARGVTLSTVALEAEARDQGRPISEIRDALRRALVVMREAIARGMVGDLYSASGLVGGDAAKLRTGADGPLAGTPFRDVLARALAVQEVNAAMGVIVAAPTAGGAGVLPAGERPGKARRGSSPRSVARPSATAAPGRRSVWSRAPRDPRQAVLARSSPLTIRSAAANPAPAGKAALRTTGTWRS